MAIEAVGLRADPNLVECLFVAVCGDRRYLLPVQPPIPAEVWIVQMQNLCVLALRPPAAVP